MCHGSPAGWLGAGGTSGAACLCVARSDLPTLSHKLVTQEGRFAALSWAIDNMFLQTQEKQTDRGKPLCVFLIDAQITLPATAFEQANGMHSLFRALRAAIQKQQNTAFQSPGSLDAHHSHEKSA